MTAPALIENYGHLCLFLGYNSINHNSTSGTSGCLSDMAFAAHHLFLQRCTECALLHRQRHRVRLHSWGENASNCHCSNLLVAASRKPNNSFQILFFSQVYKANMLSFCTYMCMYASAEGSQSSLCGLPHLYLSSGNGISDTY